MNSTEKRLIKEYMNVQKELAKNGDSSLRKSGLLVLQPKSQSDMYEWQCTIQGPSDTPYENAAFDLSIKIPASYPLVPPLIKFVVLPDERIRELQAEAKQKNGDSEKNEVEQDDNILEKRPAIRKCYKMPHPNVNFNSGEICLDILKKRWSPAWTLQSTILAIVVLLSNPEPSSPLNVDLANLLRCDDKVAYNTLIRFYIKEYSTECAR